MRVIGLVADIDGAVCNISVAICRSKHCIISKEIKIKRFADNWVGDIAVEIGAIIS